MYSQLSSGNFGDILRISKLHSSWTNQNVITKNKLRITILSCSNKFENNKAKTIKYLTWKTFFFTAVILMSDYKLSAVLVCMSGKSLINALMHLR